jgi:two-component system, chemotaxis family, chemotaxis protein CheY
MAVDLTKPVLVVDDYNMMIRIMHNLLKQLGFEQVDDANDGSTALAKLRRRDYGPVSDWNMEPMTGFALLHEMAPILRWPKFRSSWSRQNQRPRT